MNNKITLSLLGGALLSGAAFAGEVAAPFVESAPSFEGDIYVGVHSDYMFRGSKLGSPMLDAGLDLTKSAYGLDFGAGAWGGSFESSSRATVNELDLYAEVSKDFGFARFTTGFLHRNFGLSDLTGLGGLITNGNSFSAANDSNEVYFTLSKDFAYGIDAAYTYFWNVGSVDNDGYSVLSLSKACSIIEGLKVTNDTGYFVEKGQLSHNTTALSYDYALTETATITPYIAYTFELDYYDNQAAPVNNFGFDNQDRFHGGVSLNVSF